MTESVSRYNSSVFSLSLSCTPRSRQKEPPVTPEVRKDRQPRAGLCGLPPVPSCTEQPIAGALRPQVQEGQEELQLQVRAPPRGAVCFLSENLKHPEPLAHLSPLLQRQYLHICSVYRPLISQRLPWSLRRAFNFQRHNRKCHLLPFDRFTHGAQRQPNVNFTLYEKKGTSRWGSGSSGLGCRGEGCRGTWVFSSPRLPLALPLLNHSAWASRTDKQVACLIVNKKSYCL